MPAASVIELLLLLLIVASVIAIVTIRLRIPYTIALVVGGFLIDIFRVPIIGLLGEQGSSQVLTPDVIFMIFLPGLLFEAGLNIQARQLRKDLVPILLLAVVGVVIATLVTGFAIHWVIGFPWLVALLFGALISATDPISVLALFREMGVSKRLAGLVESESLFNDGTAVVLFHILLGAVAGAHQLSLIGGLRQFLLVTLGGALIGLGLGYLVSKLTARIDEPRIEITLTTILAYGSFLLAEELHVSGVIATVGAGLMIGNFGAPAGMSSRTKVALWSFWDYLGFVINSLIFLLIGIEVHIVDLAGAWRGILLAIAAVLLGRAITIYTLTPLADRLVEKIPRSWRHVLFWGGIHGGVSIALALSLAADFPHRSEILALTFGVVAFSIVVQGLTITPLMRWLGIAMGREDEYDRVKVEQMALGAALEELENLRSRHIVSPRIYERLRAEADAATRRVHEQLEAMHEAGHARAGEEERLARTEMITARKTAIQRAMSEGLVSHHAGEALMAQADNESDQIARQS